MANKYWVGGSGNWNDTNHWSSSSGGAGGDGAPSGAEDVYIDSNSPNGADYTITVTATSRALSLYISGSATYKVTIGGTNDLTTYGNTISLSGGTSRITWSHTGFFYVSGTSSTNTPTLTTNGVEMNCKIVFGRDSSTYSASLGDDLTIAGTGYIELGNRCTWTANNKNITTPQFRVSSGTAIYLTLGTGTLTLTGTGDAIYFNNPTSSSFSMNQGTIKFIANSASDTNLATNGGKTFKNLWIATQGSGKFNFKESDTFSDIKIDAGRSVVITTGKTLTTTTFTAIGESGKLITLRSSTTTNATLSKSGGGTIQCYYMDVDYITGNPDNTWYMGDTSISTDGGNNTNIYFTGLPSTGAGNFFQLF